MKNTASSKNKFLNLALVATLIAIGVHLYLTLHYYGLKYGTAEGGSICNINEVLNCDAVTASKYSALFGVPVALWGVVTNIVLLYFLAVTRLNMVQDRAKTSRYAFLFSGLTILGTIAMALISLSFMSNLCIFCMAAYVLSIIGFIGAWLGAEDLSVNQLIEDTKDIFTAEKWVGGFVLAIPAFAFLGNIMYLESHGLSDIEKLAKEKVAYWLAAPQQSFDLTAGLSMQKGSSDPVMTIVEFADFRCPHCKHAAPTLHAFANSHPDVKLIFKPFPLDGTCNEAIRGGGDGISCGLASAVMCAEKMGQKGWAAHDYFFENQEEIIRAGNLDKNLEDVSKSTGLALEELKACVKDPTTAELIRKMAKEGETAQIQGTPTVFANGKLLSGGQLIPILEAAYRSLK
ncbi:MAG: thiol:disulfide interchange protein DsbA [Bdellovibrio sp. ArHS]|uniref:vitamin K epoxide reductase/DsbA family protein n=1 Tax=Bdellovibrio sp. ArHS TaxID=1569284 RepID=UPI000582BCD5|nr:thioredoxin domain-containing protein [Bdellovibrio sp. ArHS]KHD87328.1 MAG: thiol:disulfide interchange protein DsbA [Bdellovibrio sp. ArHS]